MFFNKPSFPYTMVFLLLSLLLATAAATPKTTAISFGPTPYNPEPQYFLLSSLKTHQPNGNPDGQVNYYNLEFWINDTATAQTGFCWTFWADNSVFDPEAYSVAVPANRWIGCDRTNDYSDDRDSKFGFKLFEYFSIGNFSVEVKEENVSEASGGGDGGKYPIECVYGWTHVTNTTGTYTCEIDPGELQDVVHAHGDCAMPEGEAPFRIEMEKEENSWWY